MFGWTYTDNDMDQMGIYSTFKPDTGPGEGMYSMLGSPTFWLPYIGVEEIKSAPEKAVSLGAQFHMGPHEIPTSAG